MGRAYISEIAEARRERRVNNKQRREKLRNRDQSWRKSGKKIREEEEEEEGRGGKK